MKLIARVIVLLVVLAGIAAAIALKAHQSNVQQASDAALPVSATEDADTSVPAVAGRKQALPQLVDLGADKCVPCKAMAPILEELKRDFAGRLDVMFIDVWKDPTAGEAYRIHLIPTQIFYDAEGHELFRHEGFYSREEILAKWRELGFNFEDLTGADS